MAEDTVTLALGGEVPIAQFGDAVTALADIIDRLTRRDETEGVEWTVADLAPGSALVTVRGSGDQTVIDRVIHEYELLGAALHEGRWPGGDLEEPARRIVGIVNGHVRDVRFETFRVDFTIGPEQLELIAQHPAEPTEPLEARVDTRVLGADVAAIGSVRGRMQTLSNRGGLRFTLYDVQHDRAVSCYLRKGHEDTIRDLWGELVAVQGRVRRDPLSGRPTTVRDIRRVELIPEGEREGWRRARGVRTDNLPAEERIRRIRDAW